LIFTSKRWTIRQFFRLLAVKAYQFITFNYFYDSMDLPLMQDFNVVDVVTWLLPDVLYDAKRSNMSMAIRNSSVKQFHYGNVVGTSYPVAGNRLW